jgi:plastocyanin
MVVALLALALWVPAAAAADEAVNAGPGLSFTPGTVTVNQGDAVTWTNAGGFHNVHFEDESFIQPPTVQGPPWTTSRVFGEAGSFRYYCDVHRGAGMTGTVNVKAAAAGTSQPESPAGGTSVTGQGTQAVPGAPCASRRAFAIRLRGLDGVRVRSATVTFNGKRLPVRRQVIGGRVRHTTRIDLRGLPRGTYTATIAVTTAGGRTLRGTRTYRTCADRQTPAKLPPL